MIPFGAQDALHAMIEPIPEIAQWQIDLGLPTSRAERHIWVHDDVSHWTRDDFITGQVMVDETFRIYVYVYSRLLGATFKEQRDEVDAAGQAITAAITADPTLGGSVHRASVSGAEFEGGFADEQARTRVGLLILAIDCARWA